MTFKIVTKAYHTYLISILLVFCIFAGSTIAEAAKHHRKAHARHHHKTHTKHYRKAHTRSIAYSPPSAALVMDAETGKVLYQKNADQRLHPASLTKIMTLLLVFEAMDKGQLSLNDRIIISKHAASMAPSKLGLRPGSSISVKDAIYTVVTKSCNDIAVALAERLAGTERAFAQRMTTRAQQLGMTHTTFTDASGLSVSTQLTSARDMAHLARYVILNHPSYYRFYSTKNYYYGGQVLHNHNHLMSSYAGMDGVKSGYVQASGFNLVASAVRNNHRLIGVVFGGKTANSRNTQMARLLNAGFEQI